MLGRSYPIWFWAKISPPKWYPFMKRRLLTLAQKITCWCFDWWQLEYSVKTSASYSDDDWSIQSKHRQVILMMTGGFSRNIGKLLSKLKLVTDNLLFIYAEANWEATKRYPFMYLASFPGLGMGMRLTVYCVTRYGCGFASKIKVHSWSQ